MLSIPDMALLGAAALLLFGPEQLPRVARKAGLFMRDIQNTSQSFLREMERAADLHDAEASRPGVYDEVVPHQPPLGEVEHVDEPRSSIAEEAERQEAEASLHPSEPAKPAPEGDDSTHV